jgi:hypothetical protein
MTDEQRPELDDDDLEAQDAQQLPEREMMSIVTPEPVDGGIVLPVSSEDEEIFVYPRDPATSN